MKKQIKVQALENGQNYFTIYEVRVTKNDGETITYDRYLNKKDAEKSVEFVYEVHQNLYKTALIRESIVWC